MLEQYPSPDGQFILHLSCNEVRMSHWICSPSLVEVATGRVLYEPGSTFDASAIKWSPDSRELTFHLREYPGSHPGVNIRLCLADSTATVSEF